MTPPWMKPLQSTKAIGAFCAAFAVLILAFLREAIGPTLTITWLSPPVTFLAPSWFFLTAFAPYFFFVAILSLTDVSTLQRILSATLRSILLIGIAAALARPIWTTTNNRIATVLLVDVSPSVTDAQIEEGRQYAQRVIDAKAEDDEVFMVTFAQYPQHIPGQNPLAIQRHNSSHPATDVQSAIQLAYGLFPDGFLPRIVVLSDGNETHGDLVSESLRAKELGVRISYKTFSESGQKEIRVASMHLPDAIKQGAPFDVKVKIWSTHEDDVTVHLKQDDFPNALAPKESVHLTEGINWVHFKSQAKRSGYTTYTASVTGAKEDTEKSNNQTVMTAPVTGQPRILYVEGSEGSLPGTARHFQRALTHQNMQVEVRGPHSLPSSAKELEPYDLVFISDVPARFVGKRHMAAIDQYVRQMGGGLIMSGGEDSFGSGGYQNTPMEAILPVRFDGEKQLEQPQLAIVLVVDRSGSMTGPKLEAAKESARATAEVLSPADMIAVVAFDQEPTTIVRMQRASNRMRISSDISRLSAGGGTDIRPALQEANELLQSVRAKVKHVILLTDGRAPYEGITDLVQEMRSTQITVSAVGIGNADRNLLQLITENGDGRLYMTEDLADLPRIFMKETTEAQRSALVEDAVKAHINKKVAMIEGTGVANAPFLRGYVSTKPKPTAETILISDRGEPLLARWRVGTGSSVAWTSDIKNRWSVDWLKWQGFPTFWAQVIRTTMRRKEYDSYELTTSVQNGRARVFVDAVDRDDAFVNDLETVLEIVDPTDGKVIDTVTMQQSAAGMYTADFAIKRVGTYLLRAIHKRGSEVVAKSMGSIALPYPAEFLRGSIRTDKLDQAALETNGIAQADPKALFEAGDEQIEYTKDLWPWVLLFVAMGLVLDTFFKRVRLFGHKALPYPGT